MNDIAQRLRSGLCLLHPILRDRALQFVDENAAGFSIFDSCEQLTHDAEAGGCNAARHARVDAFAQDVHAQRSDQIAAQ